MMEQKTDTIIAAGELTPPSKANMKVAVDGGTPKIRKRGAMHVLRVALLMLRRRSRKSKSVDVTSNDMLKQLVGSMRPLHLQSSQPPTPPSSVPTKEMPVISNEHFDDVTSTPFSPGASSSSSRSVDGMSQYASAVNLQELDQDEESDNDYEMGGDEMIDVKAEEFIAHFYEQMRVQRLNYAKRYNEKIRRSMG